MADNSKSAQSAAAEQAKTPAEPQKDWREVLYTEERVMKWAKGEMTLAELDGISGPEMLEMAVTGFAMYEQGRFREARIIFDGLAALDPTEAYFRTALGAVYLAQDMLDKAVEEFGTALKLNPKDTAALVNRGEIHLRQGHLVEAAQDFSAAIELDPEMKDPMTMRARALAAAAVETLQKQGIGVEEEAAPAKAAAKPAAKAPAKVAAPVAKKPAAPPAKPVAKAAAAPAKKPAPKPTKK